MSDFLTDAERISDERLDELATLYADFATWDNGEAERDGEVATALRELKMLREQCERQEEKFNTLRQWARAYPLDVFPKPDFAKVNEVLKAAGLSLDAVSADNMRHVLKGVIRIIGESAEPKGDRL